MKTIKYPSKENWEELLKRPAQKKTNLEAIVTDVFNEVRKNGDSAVKDFTKKLLKKLTILNSILFLLIFHQALMVIMEK